METTRKCPFCLETISSDMKLCAECSQGLEELGGIVALSLKPDLDKIKFRIEALEAHQDVGGLVQDMKAAKMAFCDLVDRVKYLETALRMSLPPCPACGQYDWECGSRSSHELFCPCGQASVADFFTHKRVEWREFIAGKEKDRKEPPHD